MKKLARRALYVLAAVFVILQLVPVERTNPAVETEVPAPPEVRSILRRACYDCHSNETRWPWYGRIAPVSWLIAHDVDEARGEFNFSTWNRLSADQRTEVLHEVWEEVEEGEMPLWYYLPMHPEARLSADDLEALGEWTGAAGSRRGRSRDHD